MNAERKRRPLEALRLLSRRIAVGRSRWALGEVYRLALLLSAAVAIDLFFPGQSTSDLPVLEEGSVAEEAVIASVDFTVYKSGAELSQAREEAARGVPPIFDHVPELADSALAMSDAFFGEVEQAIAENNDEEDRRNAVREVLDRYRIAAADTQVSLLIAGESRRDLAAAIRRALGRSLRDGAAAAGELGASAVGVVVLRRGGVDRLVPRDSVRTMQQFYQDADTRPPDIGSFAVFRLYRNLVVRLARPTIRLNRSATTVARAQAERAVDPVKARVRAGQEIVGANKLVGPEEVELLEAYRAELAQRDGGFAWDVRLGSLLFNVLFLTLLALVLRYFRPAVYESIRSLTLIWILVLAVAGAAALIAETDAPPELIPIAFAALVLATLYDSVLAILASFVLVALVAIRPSLLGLGVLVSASLGGAAAALSGRVVRRRAAMWAFAAVIAAAYLLAAVSVGLMRSLGLGWVAESAFWGALNGVGSTLLAAGILPIAESFTRITTDQSLLELADLNRPLLRRLSLEAPGTYAHSINVANLAEAAAREIEANSLLVRVGAYYHDIGKVKKPQYFVENQPPGANPHDKLKPTMSANIVREHVAEGLQLADEARLPGAVKSFITEHHGTQRISFFWEKAQKLEPDAELDMKQFTYPGPKPQSKETAIVLLADSVESAARVLQDPTPERITELVDRILGFKMAEGQLEDAPLTLREISSIKEQFVKVLSGMYHHRLDYPAASQQPLDTVEDTVPGAT